MPEQRREAAALYPSATRVQPEANMNPKIVKRVQMQELFREAGERQGHRQAEAIAAMPSTGA